MALAWSYPSLQVEGPVLLYYLVESLQLDGPGLELSLRIGPCAPLLPRGISRAQ